MGQQGEDEAVRALKKAGYTVLERNVHLGRYEIDISGTLGSFDMGVGERKVVRTGALWLARAEGDDGDGTVGVRQALPDGWGRELRLPVGHMALVLPGRCRFEDGVEVEVGEEVRGYRLRGTAAAAGRRPVVGVKGRAGAEGFVVSGAVAGSPAESAGLRSGDVIVAAGGKPVGSSGDLAAAIDAAIAADGVLQLKVKRAGGALEDVTLRLDGD